MGSPCARAEADYLMGHARRVGLAGDHTPREARPQGAELHGAVAEEASRVDGRRPWRMTLTERSRDGLALREAAQFRFRPMSRLCSLSFHTLSSAMISSGDMFEPATSNTDTR